MAGATGLYVKFEKIEDFEVWKVADAFWSAVNAIISKPSFGKEFDLRDQVKDAIDSVLSNLSEGFEQPTDRGFARYVYHSKGSTAEACTRLQIARRRGLVSPDELRSLRAQGDEVRRLANGLIKYLMKTPNRRRGLGTWTDDQRLTTND